MRVVDRSTYLDAPPDKVWDAVKKPSTFEYVTKGLLDVSIISGFTVDGLPEDEWAEEGRSYELRLKALRAIPLGKHVIEIESIDEANRVIQTQEHGSAVKSWRHRITVEPEGSGTRYSDHVEIEAGATTPGVWAVAEMIYRYRHSRWKKLAKTL